MKKILILFLVLLSAPTFAVSGRRDSLRVSALTQLGIPTTGTALVTTTQVNRIIDEAVQEVSSNFPAIEKLDTVVVYPYEEGGALNTDFASIRWAQIMELAGDSVRIPLTYVDPNDLYATRGGSGGVTDAKKKNLQERYYYTHAGRLMMYARFVRGEGDSMLVLVAYYAKDAAMSTDSTETSIDEAYFTPLKDFIYYRIEQFRGRHDVGAIYKTVYDKAKSEARTGK